MLDRTAMDELSAALHVEQVLSPRNNDRVRASSIGSCRRQLAYRILGYQQGESEPPIWSHLLSIFDLGHALHLQLQQRLGNGGSLAWVDADLQRGPSGFWWAGNCEIPLGDNADWVAGRCDGLTRPLRRRLVQVAGETVERLEPTEVDDPAGTRYILDIKTVTARDRVEVRRHPDSGEIIGANVRPSVFSRLKKPKDEHIAQANIYAHLTTRPGFKTDRLFEPLAKVPDIMIIYVAKDLDPDWYSQQAADYPEPRGLLNAPFKVYTQKSSSRLIRSLLAKVAVVREHVERGSLPPRDYHHQPDQPAWACVDCPFRTRCYAPEGYFAGQDRPFIPPRLVQRLAELDLTQKRLG